LISRPRVFSIYGLFFFSTGRSTNDFFGLPIIDPIESPTAAVTRASTPTSVSTTQLIFTSYVARMEAMFEVHLLTLLRFCRPRSLHPRHVFTVII
jgi:hypothetical protein